MKDKVWLKRLDEVREKLRKLEAENAKLKENLGQLITQNKRVIEENAKIIAERRHILSTANPQLPTQTEVPKEPEPVGVINAQKDVPDQTTGDSP